MELRHVVVGHHTDEVYPSIESNRYAAVGAIGVLGVVATYLLLGLSTEHWNDPALGRKADGQHWRLSMATGTTALALLSATLLVTPIRQIRRRSTRAIHRPWRRALGIWTAVVASVHVSLGVTIHSPGWRLWAPFTHAWRSSGVLRLFGVGLWAGAAAAGLLAVLAATSNTASMRKLGVAQWKRVQRASYFVLALALVHVIAVQQQELRDARHVVMTLGLIAGVVIGRSAGALSRHSRFGSSDNG